MKHSLLSGLAALLIAGTSFTSKAAVEPTLNYTEDFTVLYKGVTSGTMYKSSAAYPARYWIREGLSTSKNININTTFNHGGGDANRCIGYTTIDNRYTQTEVLITPKVGGTVSFWVRRSTNNTSTTYTSICEVFRMTHDANGNWDRDDFGTKDGTFDNGMTIVGVDAAKALVGADYTSDNQESAWRKVTITNVPDGTYLGIHLNGLYIDDFSASKAWLEWPEFVWDGTIIPYIDVTPLGTTYTKYFLNKDNNFLDESNQPYKLQVQLKKTVNAGNASEDMFKYRFQFTFTGQTEPLRLTDKNGNDIIVDFKDRPTPNYWATTSTGEITHEEQTIDFALYNLDPKFFNVNANFQAVKLDADGNDVGAPISMQKKNTVAADGTWNANSWSNFQFEALVPQPIFIYNSGTNTAASSLTGNKFTSGCAWFINPVSNEAPIAMGNTAGKAEMKITKVEFSNNNFGLKENLTFPITVGPNAIVFLKPTLKATAKGFYTGKMSVYVEGFDNPYTLDLEGAVKPDYPTKYCFHNEDGTTLSQMPDGWLVTGKWQLYNLTSGGLLRINDKWTTSAYHNGANTEDSYLTSPKINFEKDAEVWFDATGSVAGDLEILYSKDRSEWTVLRKLNITPSTVNQDTDLSNCFNGMGVGSGPDAHPFKSFVVTIPEAGEGYISFRTKTNYMRVDNVLIDGTPVVLDYDIAYITKNIPGKFSVNKPKSVSVTYRNLQETVPAGEYDVQIVADGNVARTFKGDKDLTKGSDVEIASTYAFSTDGEHTLSFNLVIDDYSVASDEATVNVVEEGFDEVFRVGPTHTNNMICDDWNGWPLTPNTGYEIKSEAIYTKDMLQDINANGASATNNNGKQDAYGFDPNAPLTGLKAGDKITSIGWLGYYTSGVTDTTPLEMPVKLYLENTTDNGGYINNSTAFKEDIEYEFTGKLVFDMSKRTSERNWSSQPVEKLVDMQEPLAKIILDEPFEYTGENLRVQLRMPRIYVDPEKPVEGAEYFPLTTNNLSVSGQYYVINSKTQDGVNRIMYNNGSNNARQASAQIPVLLMSKETPANVLSGTVTNSKTKEGVEGVTVTVKSEEGVTFSATSGEDGKYEIPVGNPAFDFTVSAVADKYHPYTSKETVNLSEGNMTHDIVLNETALELTGIITSKEGPIEGATVTMTAVDEEIDFTPLTTTTAADGSYSFKTELQNTSFFIKAEAQYYISQQIRIATGTTDKDVQTITLVHLASLIDGTVVNADGATIKGATVTLLAKTEGAQPMTYTTDDNGRFLFTTEELDTDYTLTIAANGYLDYTKELSVGTENIPLGKITLEYVTVNISGKVVNEEGTAVQGANVSLSLDGQNLMPQTATTGADGTFTIETRYLNAAQTLTIEAEGYAEYTQSIQVADQDIILDDIELAYQTVDIAARVINKAGEAIEGATVTLQLNGDTAQTQTATTGADGTFAFTTRELNAAYTLTVEAEGYQTYTATLNVREADLMLNDIVLKALDDTGVGSIYFDGIKVVPGFGQIDITADGSNVIVIDLNGRIIARYQNLNGTVTVDGLTNGIYLVNTHKVIVR